MKPVPRGSYVLILVELFDEGRNYYQANKQETAAGPDAGRLKSSLQKFL